MRMGRNDKPPPNSELVIDISAAINQRAGIGRYARELTRCLVPLLNPVSTRLWYAEDESSYDPTLIEREPWNRLVTRKAPISRLNVDRLIVRENLPLQRFLRLGRPSDVYSPDFTTPAPAHARSHITVHDLAWLHPEARTPKPLAAFLAPVVERAVRSATTVFTVSRSVRTEIVERYAVAEERILVVPNAAAEHFFDAQPFDDDALVAFGIRHPFLLVVGTIEPRKNLTTLFDAVSRLDAQIQLVVAGREGWNAPSILARIGELDLAGRVVTLGFFADDALPRLMAAADIVVYPSVYEGFGLPIIEALATGAPVVASDLPVFREVGGSSVDYFDPNESEHMMEIIEHVLARNSRPSARADRIQRARSFDWGSSARCVAQRLLEVS